MVISYNRVDGIPRALPATSFQKETLQHLIVTGQAIPTPPSFAEVLCYMEHHGKNVSVKWHQDVIRFLFRRMNKRKRVRQGVLFVYCLKLHVQEMLLVLANPDAQCCIQEVWVEDAFHKYMCRGLRDLLALATYSFAFIKQRVEEHNEPVTQMIEPVNSTSTSTPPRVLSTNVVSPSSTNVVSPSSSQF